ncbi:MAG: cyclase family protein [Atopostipes sp.]|nr:cyclase family protein [Atopostipes sp.]
MEVIDLSKTIHSEMTVYPGDPEVEINLYDTYAEDNWELRELKLGTHTGTHVDSFSHMHPGKESIDQLSVECFFGEAERVLIADDWPEELALFFTEKMELALFEELVRKNPPFVGGRMSEALERALLGAGIITYTDLVNLDQIPLGEPFTFYGLPLKLKEGDGSPVRAIAVLEE